jgi:hypothetical protein
MGKKPNIPNSKMSRQTKKIHAFLTCFNNKFDENQQIYQISTTFVLLSIIKHCLSTLFLTDRSCKYVCPLLKPHKRKEYIRFIPF